MIEKIKDIFQGHFNYLQIQQGSNTTPLTLSYYVNDYLGNTRMVYTPHIETDGHVSHLVLAI